MKVIFADTLVSLPEEAKTITVQPGPPDFRFTDEEFERYCAEHTDLRIEVELRSKFDRLKTLRNKMEEYLANGAQLGWLIDPLEKKIYLYRPGLPVEIPDNPTNIAGDPLLKGFVLKFEGILD